MLQPAWYLTDGDVFAELRKAPRLDDDGHAILGQIAKLFSDQATLGPAKTIAAVYVTLLAAEHLGDNLAATAVQHDLADLTRLVAGLNLLQTQLAQTLHRLGRKGDARRSTNWTALPSDAVDTVTDRLDTASALAELCAGHLKEVDVALRTTSAS